ncbi:MAG: hypothetical protein GXO86_13975 [Chlorobi bacterium]|nr:hypothetical protein [Chlorobiota bacterium]
MSEKKKIWTVHHKINWDDTNMSGTLNLTGLNVLLQRAAVEHAEYLGFGYHHMIRQNLSWVLFRINIQISRMPGWQEKVRLVTWPRELANLTAFREFILYSDKSDEILCRASSEWLLINLDTRRPQKMDDYRQFEKYTTPEKAIIRDIPKVNRKQDFTDLFSIVTRYSGLDLNGHANARKYIDWLDDAIYEVHGEKTLVLMHMTYFHECIYGEELIVQKGGTDPTVFRGWKPAKNEMAFLAKVEIDK